MRLSMHAKSQAHALGIHPSRVLQAASDPSVSYSNHRHPHQRRHVRDGICAVVDLPESKVVTFYLDAPRDKQFV